ncbi:peptidoglycan-binding protein [Clostridium sp. SHJSY1]|uniref:peptidoglycan-binding domain-containing protein n=1 Tax=Clostridium sp. SHJSY1 TaxID=2942483 RepID=UPI00287456A7|nr:peptidoglycan-binding domain-containing protein [Clostridium sp. SHJSY1]MDS0526553.1 peptidoglycan-binding protein [Clostridium sp. SHJSY1]
MNCQGVSGTSGAKSLLSDGAHLVIARMAPGHVTRQGHFIVLSGWVTVNGKVYFKVYDPHCWNEYYKYDGEIIDDVKDDGFILLSETAIRNEAIELFGFSNKNNSKIDNGQGSSTGGSTSNPGTSGSSSENNSTLRMGSQGEEVKKLQNLLISKGYSCGPYGADGDFGQGTYDAVVAFQKANKLEQDGVVGSDTWAALNGSSGSGNSGGSNNNQGTSTGNQESDNSKDETSFFQKFIDAYKKHQTSGNILYDEINFWTLGTLDSFKAVTETKPFTLENLKANFKLFLNTAPFVIPAGKTIDSFVSGATKYVGSLFAKKVGCTETTVAIDEAAASIIKGAGNASAKGLLGKDFEDYLTKIIGGEGSFSKGGRDFDGGIGNRWWEAKSGGYWDMIMNNQKQLNKFKDSMGDRLRIAKDNGATYELLTNARIPQSIKDWLTKKGIPFTELLD